MINKDPDIKTSQYDTSDTAFNKIWDFIAIIFFGAIIAGLAFIGIRAIVNAHHSLTRHQAVGYMADSDVGLVAVLISGGLICLGWSLLLAIRTIRILVDRLSGMEQADSLSFQIAKNFYPLFTIIGIVFLAGIAGGIYYGLITENIPSYVSHPVHPELGWATRSGRVFAGMIIGVLLSIGALAGAVYLALRLVADAVKFFLREDSSIK